jgi:hypothetical protein
MTEGSAVSAFDLTSARPDTAHQQVGGSPGLPGTRNGCILGLNRRPIWWMSVKSEIGTPIKGVAAYINSRREPAKIWTSVAEYLYTRNEWNNSKAV